MSKAALIPFPDELLLRDLPQKPIYFELTADFRYFCRLLNCWVVIPKGFDTDFASIPAALKGVFNPVGKVKRPAVIHDFGYYYRYFLVVQPDGSLKKVPVSREIVDDVFLCAMEDVGIGWVQRRMMYRGVQAGGWVAWGKNAKLLAAELAETEGQAA